MDDPPPPPPIGPSSVLDINSLPSLPVYLCNDDRGPRVIVESNDTCIGDAGYRSIRASHGIISGCWYFEIKFLGKREDNIINPNYSPNHRIPPPNYHSILASPAYQGPPIAGQLNNTNMRFPLPPHVRVGWMQSDGDLHAPVGYDRYSYSYRDIGGMKVHESIVKSYGKEWKENDVIGCFISLPSFEEYMSKRGINSDLLKQIINNQYETTILPRPDILYPIPEAAITDPSHHDLTAMPPSPPEPPKIEEKKMETAINNNESVDDNELAKPQARGRGRPRKNNDSPSPALIEPEINEPPPPPPPPPKFLPKPKKGKKIKLIPEEKINSILEENGLSRFDVISLYERSVNYCLGSEIRFYCNGINQGTAFHDIYKGLYMPAVALYMGARVQFNFGPTYWNIPQDLLSLPLHRSGLYPHLYPSRSILLFNTKHLIRKFERTDKAKEESQGKENGNELKNNSHKKNSEAHKARELKQKAKAEKDKLRWQARKAKYEEKKKANKAKAAAAKANNNNHDSNNDNNTMEDNNNNNNTTDDHQNPSENSESKINVDENGGGTAVNDLQSTIIKIEESDSASLDPDDSSSLCHSNDSSSMKMESEKASSVAFIRKRDELSANHERSPKRHHSGNEMETEYQSSL